MPQPAARNIKAAPAVRKPPLPLSTRFVAISHLPAELQQAPSSPVSGTLPPGVEECGLPMGSPGFNSEVSSLAGSSPLPASPAASLSSPPPTDTGTPHTDQHAPPEDPDPPDPAARAPRASGQAPGRDAFRRAASTPGPASGRVAASRHAPAKDVPGQYGPSKRAPSRHAPGKDAQGKGAA